MLLDGITPKLPPKTPTAPNAKQESSGYKENMDRSLAGTGF
jgi:hypothetical protein